MVTTIKKGRRVRLKLVVLSYIVRADEDRDVIIRLVVRTGNVEPPVGFKSEGNCLVYRGKGSSAHAIYLNGGARVELVITASYAKPLHFWQPLRNDTIAYETRVLNKVICRGKGDGWQSAEFLYILPA